MAPKVLHVLSQRPALTGSGVTLDALVRHARAAGWEQAVACGVPAEDPRPEVGGLPAGRIHPLVFERDALDFAVPGMSDVMPYASTVFACMEPGQLERYRQAWRAHLQALVDDFAPDVIHAHHVWIVSALLKDVAHRVPVVVHCHATGLRQMALCPHLAEEVRAGCARNERFVVLMDEQAGRLAEALGIGRERIGVVGAGYRDDLFHAPDASRDRGARLAYAGKYAAAKGLPELLSAFEALRAHRADLELHVAGTGSGPEAEALRERMAAMPGVHLHGMLDQAGLADLLRGCAVFALPSFYEGLPLVLVEAAACGCELVATDLPGVRTGLGDRLDPVLTRVAPPPMAGVDTPEPTGLPAFTGRLGAALARALERAAGQRPADLDARLARFTWEAVFARVEPIWRALAASSAGLP
jgi:glycosyltransferase involved in cell wall biosynthesis